jgi:hypothetical protein
MSTFLTGAELNNAIYDIIWNAEEQLIIVSPFIKLDDYFKELFLKHKYSHKLNIMIIFGKNEGSPSKSLRSEDFDFFKQFINISIIYCPNLHAKYYANEESGILSSINLYDSSFKNNIEYGVIYEQGTLSTLTNNVDKSAWKFTFELTEKNPAIFIKVPVYEKSFLGSLIGQKSYLESEILLDETDLMLKSWSKWEKEPKKFVIDFPEEIIGNERHTKRPERSSVTHNERSVINVQTNVGFCIRTGVEIPFNPQKPMSDKAYKSWNQFKNPDYEESYCHKTGKKSYGKTYMRKPIL